MTRNPAELFRVPKIPDYRFPEIRGPVLPTSATNPAKWTYERLVKSIIAFEEKLDDETELGARLVNFSAHETFHVSDLGYWGPDIVKFYGFNADGHPIELIQHLSQLSLMLVAVPKFGKKPTRIGFALATKLGSTDD